MRVKAFVVYQPVPSEGGNNNTVKLSLRDEEGQTLFECDQMHLMDGASLTYGPIWVEAEISSEIGVVEDGAEQDPAKRGSTEQPTTEKPKESAQATPAKPENLSPHRARR